MFEEGLTLKHIKKFALLLTSVVLALGCSVVALAKSGHYDDIYEGNKIIAGDGIPSGMYCLYNKSETKSASYSVKSGSYRLISDTFKYNAIVYLEDDDVLYLDSCYAVPLEDARINPVNECMVEVGEHIPSGKYRVMFLRDNSQSAVCTIYDTLDFHDEEDEDETAEDVSETKKISNGSDAEIELEEGQFVKLDGCYLYDLEDEDDD